MLSHFSLFASGAINVDIDMTAVVQFVMFLAFVVVMKDLIFDPLLRLFEERERRTLGAIERARKMDEEAIALKAAYDDKLDELRREAAVDRDAIRLQTKEIEVEKSAATRTEVADKLNAGVGVVRAELDAIRAELAKDRGIRAGDIASRVLGREVSS